MSSTNPVKKLGGAPFYIVLILLVFFFAYFFYNDSNTKQQSLSEALELIRSEQYQLEEVTLYGTSLEFKYEDEAGNANKVKKVIPYASVDRVLSILIDAQKRGQIEDFDYKEPMDFGGIMSVVSIVLLVVLIGIVFWVSIGRGQSDGKSAMSFGRSKARLHDPSKNKVTFADVAGADEEKEELTEVVDFLKNPQKYSELGAKIPRGIMLFGAPGTGKTLLAKAVAGEAGVPFFSISGSDFVEMFVGVGASRVRDLFETAKKNSPCIIFIDEIDAVGRHRGAGMGGGHDEREQTLNQLLVEMDGFGPNEGVIVIAATNRMDILDPALLRPGRFDRRVVVMRPDIKGREAILQVHAKGKPLASDVDLNEIAKMTPGFTGADLANLLNEAALLAARRGAKEIIYTDISEAVFKVVIGTEKKSRIINDKEKRLTAYHEAGHAIVLRSVSETDRVERVSIIPAGGAGGYTAHKPDEDVYYTTRKQLIDSIKVSLGGRAAEEIILGEISTGASSDLQSSNGIARDMITQYGMSDKLKNMVFGGGNEVFLGRDYGHVQNYSDKVAALIDEEVQHIIDDAYIAVIALLKDKMSILNAVANRLLEKEKIEGDEFERIFVGESLPESGASDPIVTESPAPDDGL
ncbi:MAG TPA: ATP-dependent zinc metalloprotease FtsH [Clostridiaceae bacterium]|nr:ATP-dependent zinc metalloprotease FtsH [Clostridiaceae bacterium]